MNNPSSCDNRSDDSPCNRPYKIMLIYQCLFRSLFDICKYIGRKILKIGPQIVFQDKTCRGT